MVPNAMPLASESIEMDYNDLEVQHIQAQQELFQNQGGGGDGAVLDSRDDSDINEELSTEPVEGRLDNDELAELVGYVARVGTARGFNDSFFTGDTEPGTVKVRWNGGVNLSGDELFFMGGETSTPFTAGGGNAFLRSGEEMGLIWDYLHRIGTGFNDTTNGSGGAGGDHWNTYDVNNLHDLVETGPVVDAADDLNFGCIIDVIGVRTSVFTNIHITAYWKVYRVENARPKLGL